MASQGLRKPLKSPKKTKISNNKKNYITVLKVSPKAKKGSLLKLFYLEAKNEEKLEQKNFKLFFRSKTVFANFEERKKY